MVNLQRSTRKEMVSRDPEEMPSGNAKDTFRANVADDAEGGL